MAQLFAEKCIYLAILNHFCNIFCNNFCNHFCNNFVIIFVILFYIIFVWTPGPICLKLKFSLSGKFQSWNSKLVWHIWRNFWFPFFLNEYLGFCEFTFFVADIWSGTQGPLAFQIAIEKRVYFGARVDIVSRNIGSIGSRSRVKRILQT